MIKCKCGSKKDFLAKFCWQCWLKIRQQSIKKCKNCNKRLSRNKYIYCRFCYRQVNNYKKKGSYKCLDCKSVLSTFKSKRCYSCESKRKWEIPIIRKKLINSSHKKPNKCEKKLFKLLNIVVPKEYKFTGNASFWIKRFNPDFINCNGQKKIIELYGDYWHNLPNYKKRDKQRIKTYKDYGYKTLIVWQHELKNLEILKKKILAFNQEKESKI